MKQKIKYVKLAIKVFGLQRTLKNNFDGIGFRLL